jgi:hypothetical protein
MSVGLSWFVSLFPGEGYEHIYDMHSLTCQFLYRTQFSDAEGGRGGGKG